ncbi:cache domain-containing protein [Falsirhodobacter sp. alg1]|uniref:cache domain-containing protein n=1 Tax=Falsirhodobacter sp. alg1 TaxID=1472418 RepID=UPI0007882369|nr:cache domain-containing protein [Falsirhodobacter sp. alg1]
MEVLPKTTLRSAIQALILIVLLIITATFGAFAWLKSDRITDSTLDYAVRFRTAAIAQDLARSLNRDWSNLVALSGKLDGMTQDEMSYFLSGASGNGQRVSWIGFADLSGEVVAATDKMLIGQNVGERPWFKNGLANGYAGDVHDAKLLAQLLATDGAPPRFFDLARPVTNAKGDLIGVLGMHINASWLNRYLAEASDTFGIDLFLLNQNGEVSASTTEDMPDQAELKIVRAAQAGVQTAGREIWPDGQEYFSSLVPEVTYGELPDFGWRMVGRLDADKLTIGLDLARNGAWYALAICLALIAAVTLLFLKFVIDPLTRLSVLASRVANGSQEYPENSSTTREAALLSVALLHLQQDRVSDDHQPRDDD